MAKHVVQHGTNVKYEGKIYGPGETVDLPDDVAARLTKARVVQPATAPVKKKDKEE